ncbi:hypothetical protein [Chitinophaga sp. MM2321]|uniref:hypothetical protein n=1 Tax=Chitinophaga sp. MM2321 TaxID=3137178 RepID=UPI0032D58CCE
MSCNNTVAQQSCFARVELNKTAVYIQQPFKVTYTVLTATWFTEPLEFDNIQIPGAFIIPFTKAQPGRFTDHGKSFSGIQFYYIVFPYKAGQFAVPSLSIKATTPREGSAEAKSITIHTPSRTYIVKPVPREYPANESWMVATDVQLSEHWNKPLKELRVGDVLKQTITVDANGTLPQFIPEIALQKVDWATAYPGAPTLKDTRNETDANGARIQTTTYLLTKAGTWTMPAIKLSWWNPYAAGLYARKLPTVTLKVMDNPDLGMLTTLKDSLGALQVTTKETTHQQVWLIFGIPWYQALLYAVPLVVILLLLIRYLLKMWRMLKAARKRYVVSETYWFIKLLRAPATGPDFIRRLYQWWDRRPSAHKQASVIKTLEEQDEPVLKECFRQYEVQVYKDDAAAATTAKKLKKYFYTYRRRNKHALNKNKLPEEQQEWGK